MPVVESQLSKRLLETRGVLQARVYRKSDDAVLKCVSMTTTSDVPEGAGISVYQLLQALRAEVGPTEQILRCKIIDDVNMILVADGPWQEWLPILKEYEETAEQ